MAADPKDWWDKAQIIGAWVTGLLTPVIVFIVAQMVNVSLKKRDEAMKERDVKVQTVGIAIDILKGEPRKEDKGHMALRRWAIDLVKKNADLPLPPEAEQALLDAPLARAEDFTGEFDVTFISDPPGAKVYLGDSRYTRGIPDDPKDWPEYCQREMYPLPGTTPITYPVVAHADPAGSGFAFVVLNGKAKRVEVPEVPTGPKTVVSVKFDQ